jgi:hypothetical protein
MGLDMYLEAKRYLGFNGEIGSKVADQFLELEGSGYQAKNVTIELGYWRKANAIHAWFVNNVQDGVDDCGEYFVENEKLIELRTLVEKVLAARTTDVALELLPTQSGFFYGDTSINEWYWDSLENTKEMLDKVLSTNFGSEWDIYYSSSW